MKLLIIGHKGQLAHDLTRLAPFFGFDAVSAGRPQCDVTHPESVEQAFAAAGDLCAVINAAAYTAVDAAESDAQTAFAVNRDGAGQVARACLKRSLPLIHVSSDYVFNGLKTTAYQPFDPLDPLSVYGRSKAEGEAAVRRQAGRHVIVRTSWLFGLHGHNFVKTIIRLAKERAQLRVVDDQVGCPTYAGDLAFALLKAAAMAAQEKAVWGTYHFCNEGAVTWYVFARRIIDLVRSHEHLMVREILPILTSQYPLPARRPPCAILDCTSFERTFDVQRRPWTAALKEMLADWYAAQINESGMVYNTD